MKVMIREWVREGVVDKTKEIRGSNMTSNNNACICLPKVNNFRVHFLQISLAGLLDNRITRILPLAPIVGRQMFFIDTLQEPFFPTLSIGNDFNLVGRTGIQPSFNQFPSGTKETRAVDNKHFVHGFWEANAINRGLFLDNGQRFGGKLRQGQVTQVEDANAIISSKVGERERERERERRDRKQWLRV